MISNHLVPASGPALATSELRELLTERGMDRRKYRRSPESAS